MPQVAEDLAMGTVYEHARAAWPALALPYEQFARFVRGHGLIVPDIAEAIGEDLFLACACSLDIPGALRAFRERFFSVVTLSVGRFDDSPAFADEVYQRLSETLFVNGPGEPGKIARYAGTGPLAGFVGTAARRIGLRMATAAARFQGEDALKQQFAEVHEHETALLKMRHREAFSDALSVALRQLTRRDRLILRLNLVERVSTTRIAEMYKVNQSTVSRWIQRSAQSIFATVKDLVCDELEIDTREMQSLLLLVRSQIELTMSQSEGNSAVS